MRFAGKLEQRAGVRAPVNLSPTSPQHGFASHLRCAANPTLEAGCAALRNLSEAPICTAGRFVSLGRRAYPCSPGVRHGAHHSNVCSRPLSGQALDPWRWPDGKGLEHGQFGRVGRTIVPMPSPSRHRQQAIQFGASRREDIVKAGDLVVSFFREAAERPKYN